MTDTPHFDIPFRFAPGGGPALVQEQDEFEEVRNSVIAVLSTEEGTRLDVPDFGIPPQTFREGGVNTNAILAALRRWEPRAEVILGVDEIVKMAQTIHVSTLRSDIDA